jgi:hypothetical protein
MVYYSGSLHGIGWYMQHTTLGHNHKITDGEDWKRTEQECLVEDVRPSGWTLTYGVKTKKKKVAHAVAVRRGPHLSFPLVGAWERVRPLARCETHATVGPVHARCDQSVRWPEREWPPWEFMRGGRARIYMRHLLLPWRVTVGIELHAGYMCFRCMFHMLNFGCCICFYLDVAYVASVFSKCFSYFHLDVRYVAVAIHVCYKCTLQMFQLFETYVASVLSECCICCSGYTHMLQMYVSIVSSCLLQQVLLPTRSISRASTRCTTCPCTTRRGPPWWCMKPAQHMCMHVVLPPSLSSGHARCALSRIGVRALWSPSLACS